MKLTYTNVNGYLIPNLTYKSGEQMEQLGKYGILRLSLIHISEPTRLLSISYAVYYMKK